jgi:hypothetical protein
MREKGSDKYGGRENKMKERGIERGGKNY